MEFTEEDVRAFFLDNERYARNIGEDLAPDDDWSPAMTVLLDEPRTEDGKFAVGFVLFDPQFFASQETKEALGKAIVKVLRQMKPVAASFLSTAWMANPKTVEERILHQERVMTPGMDPDRRECVFLLHCDREGNITYSSAEVKRSEGPPTLGDWERMEDTQDSPNRMSGLFPDAMRKGFSDD